MTEWQDISTAPKDGTYFLASWRPPEDEPFVKTYHICHYAHGVIWPSWISDDDMPTHWMPLPPAPPKKGDE